MIRLALACLLFVISFSASAQLQVDAKLNVGSLVTGGANVAADFVIAPDFSASVGLAYAVTGFNVSDGNFRYRTARFIPEGRYYVSPEYGADRFFIGAYGKVVAVTALETDTDNRAKGTRLVLGPMLGYKWIADSGVVVELNTAIGRSTFLSNGELANRAFGILTSFDYRLGILVGYRF